MNRETLRTLLPLLLSLNAGYIDTAGFLGLHGLFTAHVTGNFVTLAASLVHGTSGALAKLLHLADRHWRSTHHGAHSAHRHCGQGP